ncbi:MAG: hypothetical protein H6658_02085 [Ardenticatenaceae bacterium]|nr:hypothetical protein [Ardenticatenaceae bacterium]
MIDIDATARAFLLADTAVATAFADRVWASTDVPPEDYDPAVGGGVCIQSRGGPKRYEGLLAPSMQVKCYGQDSVAAWNTYTLVAEALSEKAGATVRWSDVEVLGQAIEEPETGRWFVLGFFQMFMLPSAA